MTYNQIMEKLTEIFRDIFDDDSLILTSETTANDIEGWDSLMQVNLIAKIEMDFSVNFSIQEILTLNNVGEITNLLSSKL